MKKADEARRRASRAKSVRIYDHIIGDSIEQQLVEKARSVPRQTVAPSSTPSVSPRPQSAPERDPLEIARAAGALLKGTA